MASPRFFGQTFFMKVLIRQDIWPQRVCYNKAALRAPTKERDQGDLHDGGIFLYAEP